VKPRKHSPPVSYVFDAEEAAAREAIDALDLVARNVEERYGYVESLISRLPPEEAARFRKAMMKLDDAIEAKDWKRVPVLAGSLARGWQHVTTLVDPISVGEVRTWRTTVEGKRYLVVRDNIDIERGLVRADKGETVVSLEELVRIYVARRERFLDYKAHFPGARVVEAKPSIDWKAGDEVPF
jgi:hypothetical protein